MELEAILDGCRADIYSLGKSMIHLIILNTKNKNQLMSEQYKDICSILKDMV